MKRIITLMSVAVAAIAMVACGSAEDMAKKADLVTVACNPSPLTVKGGKIDADLTVTYPKDYFNPKAILEVVPVLVYEGGEAALEPIMFQGEKVKNNYRVCSKAGGVVNQHVCFTYVEGMAKSHLELRGRATTDEKKWVNLPVKKVADGCNITETLACNCGNYDFEAHNYQNIIMMNPEGQVMYNINSAQVRNSELKGQSVADFKAALKEVAENERKTLKSVDVVAYASPDGKEDFNNKLSDNRSKSADKAFQKATKGADLGGASANVKSVGEDWEGFQALVSNSSIEDKDLILRVLSMYSDANVREREIRNMSSIFQDLAKDVLPQLRRARFIANVEYTNYTDAELQQLIKENADILDEEALLKAATLCSNSADKVTLYKKAAEKFNSERAKINLAVVALNDKDLAAAKNYLAACDQNCPDVKNLQGVVALRENDMAKAAQCFEAAKTADSEKNLGLCAIKAGNYAVAAAKSGDKGTQAALAKLLNGEVAAALASLGDCQCPKSNYIRAICLNRQGKVAEAKEALKKATDACPELAKRAQTDIEFANL